MRLGGILAGAMLLATAAAQAEPFEHGEWRGGYAGRVFNESIGLSSRSEISVVFEHGQIRGSLSTAAPLSGAGRVHGEVSGDECVMRGHLDDGARLMLRGRCTPHRFEGEYVYENGRTRQRGFFEMSGRVTPTDGGWNDRRWDDPGLPPGYSRRDWSDGGRPSWR